MLPFSILTVHAMIGMIMMMISCSYVREDKVEDVYLTLETEMHEKACDKP